MKNYKKLKIRRSSYLFILTLIIIHINNCFAQNCPYKKDTAFVVSIHVYKNKCLHLQTGGVTKYLDFINSKNVDSIIKNFYTNSIYFIDPMLSFSSNFKCFSDTNEAKKSYYFTSKMIIEKWHDSDTTIIIKCKRKSILQISYTKIIADFWIVPANFYMINGLSIGYPLTPLIYKKDYYFGLKYLYDVLKLSKRDKQLLLHNY